MNLEPTPDRDDDDADLARMKAALLDTLDARERRRTHTHRIAAVGAAGVIALGTTAGALAIAAAPQAQVNYTAGCYAAADLDAQQVTSVYGPGDQAGEDPTPVAERVSLAIDMCAASWRIGTFQLGTVRQGDEVEVPPLVACELPDRRLGIFPSPQPAEEICSDLGLSTPRD